MYFTSIFSLPKIDKCDDNVLTPHLFLTIITKAYPNHVMILILIAASLAILVAWYFSIQLLSGFSYRATIGADIFLVSTFLVIVISTLIVLSQIIKASRENPIKGLKIE
jgi:putative ABC transport system permease protein